MAVRSDDLRVIRAKLHECGVCSGKTLMGCAGWTKEEAKVRLEECMDYLCFVGVAQKVDGGYQELDIRGRPTPQKIKDRNVDDDDDDGEMRKPVKRIGPVPKEGRHPYNSEHANALLMQIDAGDTLVKACETLKLNFEAVRAWRAQNPDFDKRMRFAIKMSGNSPSIKARGRRNTIKDMLRQKMTYRAIRAELGCGRSTILKAVDELEREGFDRAPIGRRRNA